MKSILNLSVIYRPEIIRVINCFVTSTSQYQVFVEKFDQEPKKVRIKMADLAGPKSPKNERENARTRRTTEEEKEIDD